MSMTKGVMAVLLLVSAASVAGAQPAGLTNAQVRVEQAAGALPRAFDAAVAGAQGPAWVGYEVPFVEGNHFICDWSDDAGRRPSTSVKLEGGDTLFVFFRIESRAVERIRMFSEGCSIDAGGLPVTWLQGVTSADSVALLSRTLSSDPSRRILNGALAALAMHRGEAATTALLSAARSGTPARLRGQALFWIAQRAGREAAAAITDAIANDPDTDVKKRAVFALSQLPADEGVPRLIEVAGQHSNPAVRKQAMFWLGQSKDPRALAFFERILLK